MSEMLWRKEQRYYGIAIQYNLWGTQDIIIAWGNLYNKLGNRKIITITHLKELEDIVKQVSARRKQKKYELVRDTLTKMLVNEKYN